MRDTGIGIAPEVQTALFAPFVQADASTTRRYGGTRLGLAIAKHLVEAMGGQIGVESTSGEGSTFWLTLRLARGTMAGDTPGHEVIGPVEAAERRGRILVAEDNAINRLVAMGLLERLGYEVRAVENGRQAVEAVAAGQAAQREPYDVVLMDVHMPEMDGLAATAAIRQQADGGGAGAAPADRGADGGCTGGGCGEEPGGGDGRPPDQAAHPRAPGRRGGALGSRAC